ncbi:SHOCT domain-containing protein [Lactiplantibacillus plantarum]|uniref:SHOCT domain-containing protein n=1 Tax=Lactiplantibacillus plantarum TaxID=1590 RepID=UPI003F52B74F
MTIYYQPANLDELRTVAKEAGINDINTQQIALKGAYKEYLFADTNQLIIVKKGFMTGHTFGSGVYRMPFTNISGVRVDFHLLSGYFEVSAGGMQNSPKNYWSNDNDSPEKSPNTISLTNGEKAGFVDAANIINNLIAQVKNPVPQTTSETDSVTELKRYKELADSGVITKTEFEAKKKQLLGL